MLIATSPLLPSLVNAGFAPPLDGKSSLPLTCDILSRPASTTYLCRVLDDDDVDALLLPAAYDTSQATALGLRDEEVDRVSRVPPPPNEAL